MFSHQRGKRKYPQNTPNVNIITLHVVDADSLCTPNLNGESKSDCISRDSSLVNLLNKYNESRSHIIDVTFLNASSKALTNK